MNATAFGAPWGAALVGSSATAVLLVFAVSAAVYFGPTLNWILHPEREARGEAWFRRLAVCILIVPLLAAALSTVRGYTVTADTILVHRLGWSSAVPLDGFESATVSPGAVRGASRTRWERRVLLVHGQIPEPGARVAASVRHRPRAHRGAAVSGPGRRRAGRGDVAG